MGTANVVLSIISTVFGIIVTIFFFRLVPIRNAEGMRILCESLN